MAEAKNYTIISRGGVGELGILDSTGEFLTVFSYGNWFSSGGSASTAHGTLTIKPVTGEQEIFQVRLGRKTVGEISFLAKGKLTIRLKDKDEKMREFYLTQPARSAGWTLTDGKDRKVLTLRSPSRWSDADQRFDVSIPGPVSVDEETLLVTCGFATNLNNTKVMALKA